jgi:hypothetical protein
MVLLSTVKNLYLLATELEYREYKQSLRHPNLSQEDLFSQLVGQFNNCLYGRKNGLITSKQEFLDRVPITNYEGLRPHIDQLRKDSINPFGRSKIKHFEATSGSSGSPKWIPYAPEIFSLFQKMFRLWSHDILKNANLNLRYGKFFFLVSPFQGEFEGLQDDRDYLDALSRLVLSPFWVGQELKKCIIPEYYLEALVVNLLIDEKVEILSFWSPRLLLSAISYLEVHHESIQSILAAGFYDRHGISLEFKKRKLIKGREFPHLKMISCWASALATKDKESLEKLFPNVFIQSKGLLATEGPLTMPLYGVEGGVPLIDDVYYEFRDEQGFVYDLCGIRPGHSYEIIFSHLGGFYRYQLGDLVRVVGQVENTPLLEFVGRKGIVSDLCGEKLSESDLSIMFNKLEGDVVLFPHQDRYIAFFDIRNDPSPIEEIMFQNPHYAFARKAGELKPLELYQLKDLRQILYSFFQEKRGMRTGDIKPQILYPHERDLELYQYLVAKKDGR